MTDDPYDWNNPANINIPEESALSKKEREAKEDDSPENHYAREADKSKAVIMALNWQEKQARKNIAILSNKQFNRKGPYNRLG